jgi:transcriptional regulator with XRE-family HTH domain
MKLKEIREARGMSQRQAALGLNLSPTVYNRYENGIREPSNALLVAIADYFHVSVDAILGREPADDLPPALDDALVDLLVNLPPAQVQRVKDFVQGMIAADKA